MKYVRKFVKPAILCLCVVVVGYAFITMQGRRNTVRYEDHKQDVVATIDGKDMLFEDLAFYILYEERIVEEQARIYNPDSTKDYWNMYRNETFIQKEVKDVILNMAIHDWIMYDLAVQDNMDTLSEKENQYLEYTRIDFWEDLLDIQRQRLPASEETINSQMDKAAVAEKYQNYLGITQGPSVAAYKYDGYNYEQMLESHSIVINDDLWERFVVGDISLYHEKANFINGLTDEEKKEDKE